MWSRDLTCSCASGGSLSCVWSRDRIPPVRPTCQIFLVKEEHKKSKRSWDFSSEGRKGKKSSEAGKRTQDQTHTVAWHIKYGYNFFYTQIENLNINRFFDRFEFLLGPTSKAGNLRLISVLKGARLGKHDQRLGSGLPPN